MTPVQRSDFGHFMQIPTRWGDLDLLGHVNNARFFTFDESVRLDYFGRYIERDERFWKDYGLILARIECDFLSQLHHPSVVDAGFRITKLGRSSLQTQGGMFVGERLVAVTRAVLVWFDYQNQKTMPIPDWLREDVRGREPVAPEEGR